MICTLCKKCGKPPPSANGVWTTRVIIDWNHTTELLKQHSGSKWHQDSSITARMAKHVEQQNVIEMQCAGAAKQAEQQKKKNREIILKLMRSIYFLAKNRSTLNHKELIELQMLNGDELLEKHLSDGSSNTQYTSRFSARLLIEAIDIWIERKLICSLQESPYFSILTDECQDISTQEELSICGRWLVNGKPEEHFLMVLHVHSRDASTIAEAL